MAAKLVGKYLIVCISLIVFSLLIISIKGVLLTNQDVGDVFYFLFFGFVPALFPSLAIFFSFLFVKRFEERRLARNILSLPAKVLYSVAFLFLVIFLHWLNVKQMYSNFHAYIKEDNYFTVFTVLSIAVLTVFDKTIVQMSKQD